MTFTKEFFKAAKKRTEDIIKAHQIAIEKYLTKELDLPFRC